MNNSKLEPPEAGQSPHGPMSLLKSRPARLPDGAYLTYSLETVDARAFWKLWQKELPELSVTPSDEKSSAECLDQS